MTLMLGLSTNSPEELSYSFNAAELTEQHERFRPGGAAWLCKDSAVCVCRPQWCSNAQRRLNQGRRELISSDSSVFPASCTMISLCYSGTSHTTLIVWATADGVNSEVNHAECLVCTDIQRGQRRCAPFSLPSLAHAVWHLACGGSYVLPWRRPLPQQHTDITSTLLSLNMQMLCTQRW